MKPRQIDLIGQDIRPIDPSFDSDTQLSFAWELWMDVDKYFGTDTLNEDETWINFYTYYHRDTDRITAEYTIDRPDNPEYKEWELTTEEEKYIREKLDEFCKEDADLPLKEYFDKLVNE